MPLKEFIVAEVSKNWPDHGEVRPETVLCGLFEKVIETNLARGYTLYSFALNQVMTGGTENPVAMTETIIAVFRLTQKGQ